MKLHNDLTGIIIGCGSIGERHLNNLISLGVRNVTVYDQNTSKALDLAKIK